MIQAPPKLLLTEFLALPETKPASEFIQGRIIQKPMPQGKHSIIQWELLNAINIVMKASRIGLALPELRCNFGGRSVVPDVVVFKWQSLVTTPDGAIANQFNIPPDWVIEILSPDQSASKVMSNILYCLEHGTEMGWLIDPQEKLIFTYMPNQTPLSFEVSDQLLAMPSFARSLELTSKQIFDWLIVNKVS